jgi:hypothetical protein
MVKIISPYSGSSMGDLGDALGQLGKSLFGDTLTPALRREQLAAKQRENVGYQTAGDMFASGDDAGATAAYIRAGGNPNNLAVGRRFIVANDPNNPLYGEAIARAEAGAGGNFANTPLGFQQDQSQRLQVAQMQADRAYAGQANAARIAADQADAAARRQEVAREAELDNTLVNVRDPSAPGGYRTVTQRAARDQGLPQVMELGSVKGAYAANNIDNMPNLPAQGQAFIGASPGEFKPELYTGEDGATYTYKQGPQGYGLYNVQTGVKGADNLTVGRLVANSKEGITGSSSVDQKLLETRTATDRASAAIDRLIGELGQANADQAVGYIGRGANLYNDIRSQVEAFGRLAGGSGETVASALNNPEIANSVDNAVNNVFRDPAFNAKAQQLGIDSSRIRSQVIDLAYLIAKSQDPGGRMSNQDIDKAAQMVMGSVMDPKTAVAVLGDIKTRLNEGQAIYERNMGQIYPKAASNMRTASPPPAGGGTPPAAQGGPAQIRNEEEYNALPPGPYIDPNGVRRVKPGAQ